MPTTLKTFDLVGKAEDVSDVISLIAPSDTPFLSAIKTEAVHNTLYQWMEDQLRAVAKNAKLEAADPADSTRDQPSMRSNGTQILEETFKVSGTSEAVKTYGRDKQAAREMMKTGKLLKMDLEYSLVGNAQTYVAATASVAGEFASVQAQISATTTTTVDGNGVTAGTPAGPLTETDLVATHEKLYNAGSDGTVLMIKPSDSKIIASWALQSVRFREMGGSDKQITNVVNVYESPFGTVRVVKNRWLKATDALIVDPSQWKLAVLRNWFKMNLAKTGDADRYSMIGEFGLKHANRAATGLITNLT